MAEASMGAFGAAIGVLIVMAVVIFGMGCKGQLALASPLGTLLCLIGWGGNQDFFFEEIRVFTASVSN